MHITCVVGDDVCALPREVIFQFLYRTFIARNDGGGEDDSISRRKPDELVCFVADARERGEFVALRACRENDDFLGRKVSEVFDVDDRVIFIFDEAEFARYLDVGAHASSIDDDLFAELFCELHDTDEALQMGSEHRDDEAAFGIADDPLERVIDDRFGNGKTRLPDVRRVHEEEECVPFLENREFLVLFFGRFSVLVVELDVAGKDDVSPRGFYDDTHRVRDRVRDREEANGRTPEFQYLVALDLPNVDLRRMSEFLLTFLYHVACETARVDHRVPDAVEDVGDAADVIEVAVRNEESADLVTPLLEVSRVGEDVIDPRCFFFTELEAAVEDKNVFAHFDRSHVASNFLYTAERDDAYRIRCKLGDSRSRSTCGARAMFKAHAAATTTR